MVEATLPRQTPPKRKKAGTVFMKVKANGSDHNALKKITSRPQRTQT